MRGAWRWAALALTLGVMLWWLRDPPFAPKADTGLRPWETAAGGMRYRWTAGRASFFVPTAWPTIVVPLRAVDHGAGALPVLVELRVDGRLADRVTLDDARWREMVLAVSRLKSSRRFRRVDLRVNRVWSDRRLGVQLGEVRSGALE
jgi:hypothetical protein